MNRRPEMETIAKGLGAVRRGRVPAKAGYFGARQVLADAPRALREEAAMHRTLLEKPFDPGQIRRRPGRNGMLDYAGSFEIAQHEVRDDDVIVLGRLTAGPIAKMAFGASQVTRERAGGAVVSLGDDLKAAATRALTCRQFAARFANY